ncbi:MAG: DEAD/DEAH box helicase [Rhodoferax sp.]
MTDVFNAPGDGLLAACAVSTPTPIALAADPAAGNAMPNGFLKLGLAAPLLQAVQDLGYTEPTLVQKKTIPLALQGQDGTAGDRINDLMVSSQTGSGKTAAFLLPVLHTLLQQIQARQRLERAEFERAQAQALACGEAPPKRAKRKDPARGRHFTAPSPGALILCPTRELAQQVAHDAIDLVRHCRGLRVASIVGGMPYPVQIAKLQNANLVVATPGRLLDLQRSMQIKLDQVQFLVVDEADRMLDLGFADDLAEINQLTSGRRQTMMFSATFAPRIQQLALRVMHDGGQHVQKVQIDTPQEKHANIRQILHWADNAQHKRALLDHWLRDTTINQAIVFASTQIECDGLANDLQQAGFDAVALHGALSQGLRNRRLMALRQGHVQILVATDVAARGIDVPTITHVFNFGLPMKAEDYTHRIGRTGRAGRDGLAVTFAELRDRRKILDIEAYTRQPIKPDVVAGLEPKVRIPEPRSRFGGRGAGAGRDRKWEGGGRGWGGDLGRDAVVGRPVYSEKYFTGPRVVSDGSYEKNSYDRRREAMPGRRVNFDGGLDRPTRAPRRGDDARSPRFEAQGLERGERAARPAFDARVPVRSSSKPGWGKGAGPRALAGHDAPRHFGRREH